MGAPNVGGGAGEGIPLCVVGKEGAGATAEGGNGGGCGGFCGVAVSG